MKGRQTTNAEQSRTSGTMTMTTARPMHSSAKGLGLGISFSRLLSDPSSSSPPPPPPLPRKQEITTTTTTTTITTNPMPRSNIGWTALRQKSIEDSFLENKSNSLAPLTVPLDAQAPPIVLDSSAQNNIVLTESGSRVWMDKKTKRTSRLSKLTNDEVAEREKDDWNAEEEIEAEPEPEDDEEHEQEQEQEQEEEQDDYDRRGGYDDNDERHAHREKQKAISILKPALHKSLSFRESYLHKKRIKQEQREKVIKTVQLRDFLQHEKGFRLFATHLAKEFSSEL
ncbi:hypothetical protein RFI_17408 [Reticulomyxa filosa]|uniref:Uncharacterized protein n=1 Tax=Reticulomyxa filosa TaxID=46433 RepID=X6N245_RETFI|nr:hypothetical protein RFI_17408 [Reticulomyxa filosa]|eukprot:ETO19819.1 hypothetical protein RFI_17408 [Reticulomyxa filosa]